MDLSLDITTGRFWYNFICNVGKSYTAGVLISTPLYFMQGMYKIQKFQYF